MKKKETIKALACKQNNYTFYLSVINSSILKEVCYVARRDEDSKKGFQRLLSFNRAKAISKYLEETKGAIPTSLILSAQTKVDLRYNRKAGEISFYTINKGFLVLDGQHRLFGLILSKINYEIPVIIFNGLNPSDEVGFFIDINTTQKGVPTTLLLDIKYLSGKESTVEEKLRLLFDMLDGNSVLSGLLSPRQSKAGKISRVTFNNSVKPIFEEGFYKDEIIDTAFKGIKNYLAAIERIFNKSGSTRAKLNNSVFFKAIFNIFNDVIDKTLQKHGNLKIESFEEILEPLSAVDYDTYIGTNKATIQKVTQDMKSRLKEYEIFSEKSNEDLY
jgi:DGQHR domain-containing protein